MSRNFQKYLLRYLSILGNRKYLKRYFEMYEIIHNTLKISLYDFVTPSSFVRRYDGQIVGLCRKP